MRVTVNKTLETKNIKKYTFTRFKTTTKQNKTHTRNNNNNKNARSLDDAYTDKKSHSFGSWQNETKYVILH